MDSLIPALQGGCAIGAAVGAHALISNRVTGISGHAHRVLALARPADGALLLGLAAAGFLAQPHFIPATALPLGAARAAAAGLLVGTGTAMANGCTSGHAVCGLARLSRRSLVAVLTFMAAAAVTVGATRTATLLVAGGGGDAPAAATAAAKGWAAAAGVAAAAAAVPGAAMVKAVAGEGAAEVVAQAAVGLAFGGGLVASSMSLPLQVASFFATSGWDPALAAVFPGALALSGAGFWLAARRSGCLAKGKVLGGPAAGVDRRLLGGSLLFGIGWGLAGLCPGPAMVLAGAAGRLAVTGQRGLVKTMAVYFASFVAGSFGVRAADGAAAKSTGQAGGFGSAESVAGGASLTSGEETKGKNGKGL